MELMIVESPNKAKHIQHYVDSNIKVVASGGHVRDLPQKEMGISFPDWRMSYEVPAKSKKTVSNLKKLAQQATKIYIATDPDREGEAIAWHLAVLLKISPENVIRVKYGDVSAKSVNDAINNPTKLNVNLVRAQETRRAIDRLVGYTVSPILSRFKGIKLSAGRVQSVAVRLIVERFLENKNHQMIKHYGAEIIFDAFKARWDTGPYIKKSGAEYNFDRNLAQQAASVSNVMVTSFEKKPATQKPNPPFSTSTLQQVGAKSLGIPLAKIMQLAQSLFEKGLITYHRTDSVELTPESIQAIRAYADAINLPLPQTPNEFKNGKNSQEAHEAIRPTDITDDAPSSLNGDELALYKLIHRRALASQLAPAKLEKTKVEFVDQTGNFLYKANSSVVVFQGFKVLDQTNDDSDESNDGSIPMLSEGHSLNVIGSNVLDLETKPPSLFTEATILKELEKRGIGRPSTWATVLTNIQNRGYVVLKGKSFIPSDIGLTLYESLKGFSFVEYDFTSNIEDLMDDITQGSGTYNACVSKVFSTVLEDIKAHLGYSGDGSDLFLASGERDFMPTEKMVEISGRILNDLNLEHSEVDLQSGQSVKAFLEKYMEQWKTNLPPSPAQIAHAQKMAGLLKVSLSEELLSSRTKLSKWIDANGEKTKAVWPPSDAQIGLANKIAETLRSKYSEEEIGLTPQILSTQTNLSAWIDENMEKADDLRAPSEAQINAARKVAEKNGVQLPDKYDTSFAVCSAFLNTYSSGSKKGTAGKRRKKAAK